MDDRRQGEPASREHTDDDPTIIVINGKRITESNFDEFFAPNREAYRKKGLNKSRSVNGR